jgi:2-keto-4-pentenoate hydratase/2-oxohepta-3-ene-1,7-dioic acid hydratase in catechol pathway
MTVKSSFVSSGPGLATVQLNGTPQLAVWANGFLLPLEQAAHRCGLQSTTTPGSARDALSNWDHWCAVMAGVSADGISENGWLAEADVTFLPSVPDPSAIYCAAANYHDHVKEMSSTVGIGPMRDPMHFLTPPATLAAHRQPVARPAACERFDWEVELAVIIGKPAANISAADANDVIAGYAVANDLSVRDFARREDFPFFPDWLRMKGYTGCLPLGPAIIPACFVPDPMGLDLLLSVNGVQRQASNTRNMIFSIAEQIEYLSGIVPLRPGDIVLTGTPAGTGNAWGTYLSPGDVVVAGIEGLGRLETSIAQRRCTT